MIGTLSSCIISSIYYTGIFLRAILVAIINIFIFARLRHAATDKTLILPLKNCDLSLEKRDSHYGICLKILKLNSECPLAYHKFRLSKDLYIVLRFCECNNLWIGFSRNAEKKIYLTLEGMSFHYYLVTEEEIAQQFPFLSKDNLPKELIEDNEKDFFAPVNDEFQPTTTLAQEPRKNLALRNSVGTLLLDFLQTLCVVVKHISVKQENVLPKKLNFSIQNFIYSYEKENYVASLENFVISFENDMEKNILCKTDFSEKLVFSVGDQLKLAFENSGHVNVNLSETALFEFHQLFLYYFKKTNSQVVQEENCQVVQKASVKSHQQKPLNRLRVQIELSILITVTSVKKNIFKLCLSDLQVCFDNIIDKDCLIAQIGNFSAEIIETKEDRRTKFLVGLLECRLTYEKISILCCEETLLNYNDLPLLYIDKDVEWHCDSYRDLHIFLKEKKTHLRVCGAAERLQDFFVHIDCVTQDILDSILPNRAFIPGLAEARLDYHKKTDVPLSVEENNIFFQACLPDQTRIFLSVTLETNCNVEMVLCSNHSTNSYATLYMQISSVEACFFALPKTIQEFCQPNLTSTLAIDITQLAIEDSVENSHWRHAVFCKDTIQIRYLQKLSYLPTLRCEKKIGFHGKKLRFEANIHESCLRFMIDYVKTIFTQDKPNANNGSKEKGSNNNIVFLRMSPLTLTLSYKPMTSHGTIVYTTFCNSRIPNIFLSGAKVILKAYRDYNCLCLHTTFSEAMKDYFSCCVPQLESIVLSASKALPLIQPIVVTATDLVSDLKSKDRTWTETAARVTSNILYGSTKISVAAYKLSRSTDRWLEKKQKSHLNKIVAKRSNKEKLQDNDNDSSQVEEQDDDDNNDDDDDDIADKIIDDKAPRAQKNIFFNKKNDAKKNFQPRSQAPQPQAPQVPQPQDNISIYANQPQTFKDGLSDGSTILQDNIQIAINALVKTPKQALNCGTWQQGAVSALYGIPRALTRSVTGLSGATVKLGHGLSNAIDEKKYKNRHRKWKSESYKK